MISTPLIMTMTHYLRAIVSQSTALCSRMAAELLPGDNSTEISPICLSRPTTPMYLSTSLHAPLAITLIRSVSSLYPS